MNKKINEKCSCGKEAVGICSVETSLVCGMSTCREDLYCHHHSGEKKGEYPIDEVMKNMGWKKLSGKVWFLPNPKPFNNNKVFCCWCGEVHEDVGCPKLMKDKNFKKLVRETLKQWPMGKSYEIEEKK